MKRYIIPQLSFLFIILLVVLYVSYPIYGEESTKFDVVEHPDKVYDGETATLKFKILNPSLTIPEGHPLLFLRIYLDGILIRDELPESWELPSGHSIERTIITSPLQGPKTHRIRGELYWLNNSLAVLQDVTSFEITVVNLEIKDFKQSLNEMILGQSQEVTFQVEFTNGGNDIMYDVTLKGFDGPGFHISPTQVVVGNLNPSASTTVDLNLQTSPTLSEGNLEIPYEISYKDFKGTLHTDEFKGDIAVRKASANIQLTLERDEIVYNSDITIEAYISNREGNPLTNQPVEFYLDNNSIGIYITDERGVAFTNLDEKINVGVHEVKAQYRGSQVYTPSYTIKTLKIIPSTSSLHLSIPSNLQIGEEARAYVKLLDEGGSPIIDAEILIYSGNDLISTAITNRTGEATIPFTVTSRGEKTIKAVYNGDLNYQETEKIELLTATQLQTLLTIDAPTQVWKGNKVTYTIRLADELGRPIPDASIEITIIAQEVPIATENLMTDNLGNAEGSLDLDSGGEISISVVYKGDERYAPVESSSKLNVLEAPILALIAIPMAGVFGAIIAVLFWKRRSFTNLKNSLNRSFRRSAVNTKSCISCHREIPLEAPYCDLCGASQISPQIKEEPPPPTTVESLPLETPPPENIYQELDMKVLSYIEKNRGEISISKGVKELGISREELLASIDRLRKAGRLEQI